jgi:hypothetical protein
VLEQLAVWVLQPEQLAVWESVLELQPEFA